MKKIISAISTLILSMGLMAGVASAEVSDTFCNGKSGIYETGPDSNNYIYCESNVNVEVTCDNNVFVTTDNDQTAVSGDAKVYENTSGGDSDSGDVENANYTETSVSAVCGSVATAPTPKTPAPVKPQGQGQGQAEDKVAPAAAKAKQVEAPKGAVNAGAGGSTATSIAAIAGLIASIGAVASGAFLFKKFLV